ncbi:MAG: photosynthetic complex putative assembly protein PuhB [Rhodospirillaceae bacterium]|nr:photosynthetic complex putative assembly protein PuhB [Rhodospirillaceae bacterium]
MIRRSNDEPVCGLPERLPEGEMMLWQGAPSWKSLCMRLFKCWYLAGYFLVIAAWRVGASLNEGNSFTEAAASLPGTLMLAVVSIAILALIAWLIERTTVYTITNRRIVIRFGIALPMTINLPFKVIGAADLRIYRDGSGDIPVRLKGSQRIGYLTLWPHVKPWRLRHPEPMLRCVPDAEAVADMLATSWAQAAAGQTTATVGDGPVAKAGSDISEDGLTDERANAASVPAPA